MRIISSSVLLLDQPNTPLDAMRRIEMCGRVCYKSEGKITPDSYQNFIKRIVKRGHEAVLEHAALAVRLDSPKAKGWFNALDLHSDFCGEKLYLKRTRGQSGIVLSGNFRAWRDALRLCINGEVRIPRELVRILEAYSPVFSDLLGLVGVTDDGRVVLVTPSELKADYEIRAHTFRTFRFVCDRGVSHELVRHRPASFCQESTRYCNYAREDFGKEIAVILPRCFGANTVMYGTFMEAAVTAERLYFELLDKGATAQEARAVLPNCLKTELVMTAPIEEWLHVFRLRCSEVAHPQMREVATRAKELLIADMPQVKEWL